MIKLVPFLLLIALGKAGAQNVSLPQTDSMTLPHTVFFVNPLSLAISGITLGFEHTVDSQHSVAVVISGFYRDGNTWLPITTTEGLWPMLYGRPDLISAGGFAFRIEGRHYLDKAIPFGRYVSHSGRVFYNYSETMRVYYGGGWFSDPFTAGGMSTELFLDYTYSVGKQWKASKHFLLDAFGGIGGGVMNHEYWKKSLDIFPSTLPFINLRAGLRLGIF